MKKLIFFSLCILASISANAQLVKSRTFAKKESNTTWYTRLGLSVNNMAGNMSETPWANLNEIPSIGSSWGSAASYDITFGFQKPINRSDVYWGMDLGIGTRGFSHECYAQGTSKLNEKLNSHNVKFSPVTFGYKHELFDQFSIDIHVGGYFSYDFAGKLNRVFDGTNPLYEEESDQTIGNIEKYVRYDAGVAAGAGIWYNRFNLDFTYQRGFISVVEFDEDMYSSKFMIRLGVSF